MSISDTPVPRSNMFFEGVFPSRSIGTQMASERPLSRVPPDVRLQVGPLDGPERAVGTPVGPLSAVGFEVLVKVALDGGDILAVGTLAQPGAIRSISVLMPRGLVVWGATFRRRWAGEHRRHLEQK